MTKAERWTPRNITAADLRLRKAFRATRNVAVRKVTDADLERLDAARARKRAKRAAQFLAKYDGRCANCRRPIEAGMTMIRTRADRKPVHANCCPSRRRRIA